MAVSTTQITASELGLPVGAPDAARYVVSPARYLVTAQGDVANLDRRIDRIGQLIAAAPPDQRARLAGQLAEIRGGRDALVQDLDALTTSPRTDWARRRAQLDSDWDALLTRVDNLTDRIPTTT